MIMQKRYRESVSPDPAVKSGLVAMVDGVYIVLKHAKRYDTPRALWAVHSAGRCSHLSQGERQVCTHR